jgi:hypothetical protein
VEIERDHPVCAGGLDGVSTDPSPDRYPRLVFLVPLGVAEVRDDGSDRQRTGPFKRVNPEQQLHEVVVGRERRALHQEDIPAAHVFENPHEQVAL